MSVSLYASFCCVAVVGADLLCARHCLDRIHRRARRVDRNDGELEGDALRERERFMCFGTGANVATLHFGALNPRFILLL